MNFLLSKRICRYGFLKNMARLFSTSKIEIQMHQAILATKIIGLIESDVFHMEKKKRFQFKPSQRSDGLKGPFTGLNTSFSLRANLISMIESYSEEINQLQQQGFNTIDQNDSKKVAAKNMMNLFEGGVFVQDDMCSQYRFLDETEQKNAQEPEMYKKLSFCPTYLVTGQIFRKIILDAEILMITGHFGTGKTHSFMLYHLLSQKIYQYLHSCRKQQIQPSLQIKLKPKLIYWTINLSQVTGEGNPIINEIIKRQCFEIMDQFPNYNFTSITRGQVVLKDFYRKKGIKLRLVIDQIQTYSNEKRFQLNLIEKKYSLDSNEEYLKLKEEARQKPQLMKKVHEYEEKHQAEIKLLFGLQQQINTRLDTLSELNVIMKSLRDKFGKIFYLSSKNIEKYVLKKLNLTGQGSHFPLVTQSLEYKQYQQTSQNNRDLAELIAFMLEIKIRKNYGELTQKQKTILQETKKIVFQQLQDQYYLLMPLSMSLVIFGIGQNGLGKSQTPDKIMNQNNLSQLSSNVKKLLVQIDQRSNSDLIQLINNFTQKTEKNKNESKEVRMTKKILMLKLLYAAKSIQLSNKLNPQSPKKPLQIDIQSIFSIEDKKAQYQILQQLNKNLFYCVNNKFQSLVHEDTLSNLLSNLQVSLLKALLESDAKIFSLIQTDVSKGLYIESLIRRCLSVPQTSFTFWLQYENTPKQFSQRSTIFSKINKTDKKLFFTPIPLKTDPKYHQFSFLKSFESQIPLDGIGSYFFLPKNQRSNKLNQTKKNEPVKEVDQLSKKIDFVLVSKQSKRVIITAFDVTISLKQATKKISDFFIEFNNFADKHRQKIEIQNQTFDVQFNYVILVPKLLKNKIQWATKLKKQISRLKQQLEKLKSKKGSEKDQAQTQERIAFLSQLLENSKKYKSVFEVEKKPEFKTMLNKVAIVSFFDATLENSDKGEISFELRLLNQAKRDYFEGPNKSEKEHEEDE